MTKMAAEICEAMAEDMPDILLCCGEMTAQERRTASAVLRLAAARIRDGWTVKDGKLVKRKPKQTVSEHIRQKKSKRVRVVKRGSP